MNGWLTSLSFHANQPSHSWVKPISNFDLETSPSRSWMWSKGKVIQSAQHRINSLPFSFTSIRPTIPEIQLFQNLTLKNLRSRSWVRSKVRSHSSSRIQTMHFLLFHTNWTNHFWDMVNSVFDLEITHLQFYPPPPPPKKKVSNRISPKSNQHD